MLRARKYINQSKMIEFWDKFTQFVQIGLICAKNLIFMN